MKLSFPVSQPFMSWSKGMGLLLPQEASSHQSWGMGTGNIPHLSALPPLLLQSLEFQPLMHTSISSALSLFLPLSTAAALPQRTLLWAPSSFPSGCNLRGKSLELTVRLPTRQPASSYVFVVTSQPPTAQCSLYCLFSATGTAPTKP